MYTKKNWKHIPTEKPVHDDHNSTIQYSQKCKEYKHLSADAWISQYGTYITMEYHPFIKRNNVLTHTAVINLKDMRITEKKTDLQAIYCTIYFMRKAQNWENQTESRGNGLLWK